MQERLIQVGSPAIDTTQSAKSNGANPNELLAEAEILAGLGSWEHDLVSGAVKRSPNLCRMLGAEPGMQTVPEDFFWRMIDPQDRECVQATIRKAMDSGRPYEYQARIVLPDGSRRTLMVRGKPIVDSENRIYKRIGVAMDVTERVESANAVRESAELYRDLVENSRALIFTHDLSGRLLSMNELPARILGYTPEELIGQQIPDILRPGAREFITDYIERIRREGSASGTVMLRTRAGERKVWEYHNTLRTEGVPAPVVRGTAHDITERFETEKKLRRSEALLAQAEELANVGSWEFELPKQKLYWSNHYYRMLGLDAESGPVPYGRGIALMHPEDRERGLRDSRSLTRGGQEFENELRFVLPNGQERVFHSRAVAEADANGRVVRVRGMSQDVTERKREEQKLRKSESLLSQAEHMTDCGSWELDLRTQKVILSKQLRQMLGIEAETEWGPDAYWERVHPEDRERLRRNRDRAIAELKPFEHVCRYMRPDGEVRYHYAKGIPVAGPDGVAESSIGVVQDITERVRSEEALHGLLGKLLSVRDEDRRRLARELHESVGQTLAALTMSLGRLRDSLPGDDTPAHALWRSCSDLTRQAARETREVSYSMHPHMLDEAGLGSALRCFARDFADLSGIDVRVDVSTDFARQPREVETTIFRIVQEALTNVHRHSGSRTASVHVSREKHQLRTEVRDDGRGLPSAHPVLGDPLPTGVGLTGMKERAEQMNGVFELESTPGHGTIVRVTLPLSAAH